MRLFYAIWPDSAASLALAEVAGALAPLAGGRPVPREKIHLTLAFLGEVTPQRMDQALAIDVRAAPFDLRLDRVGAFRGARVAWAGTAEPPPGLLSLQSRLAEALRALGFDLEERPFAAHATLARKIARPVPLTPMAPVQWRVGAYALVQTLPGTGRYATVREWNLGD
jgi:RNA 2',3'-cyclic 3'-phosphodiesterase